MTSLVGRAEEQARIDRALVSARQGRSVTLVLQGEAGIGKTALLEYATSAARDMFVLSIAGFESESTFGFAALQRLLMPVADRIDELPDPQREALRSAFGLAEGPPADRFLASLGALTLLADVSARQPLLCLVDDAQWLDRESLDALAFVGRRLHADPVVLLFAERIGPAGRLGLDGLDVLSIENLPEGHAAELLALAAGVPVADEVARQLVSAAQGSPLAVKELVRGLSAAALAGVEVLPHPLPLGGRLEAHFLARCRSLPDETQLFLLLAAAEQGRDPATLWRAAELLGLRAVAAHPAEKAGLIQLDVRVEFQHPLVRSAVYGGASAADRRRVHAALADAADPEFDPDERVWHLAASVVEPTEGVAAQLEARAVRARDRGHYSSHAAMITRSADLTPDPDERARRSLDAAQAQHVAGSPQQALDLLERSQVRLREPIAVAQATRLRASLDALTVPARIPAVLLTAARNLEGLDVRLARDTYTEALYACMLSDHFTKDVTPREVATSALAAPARIEAAPTVADLMLEGFANRLVGGFEVGAPLLRRAMDALCDDDMPESGFARWGALAGYAASELLDIDAYQTVISRLEEVERARGALDSLRVTLSTAGYAHMFVGRFAAAETAFAEASEISAALGEDPFTWTLMKVGLVGWQGREDETRSIVGVFQSDVAAQIGAGAAVNNSLVALTTLELGLGDYEAAFTSAWTVVERDPVAVGGYILADAIEAAVRCGRTDQATLALERLRRRAAVSPTPWALGLLARGEALVANGDAAERHYRGSVEQLGRTNLTPEVARSHLLFGEWLRRRNRRVDARLELRAALDIFSAVGADAFATRARGELAATGERARLRSPDTADELTPREMQIASLAATGATNSEIASRLYLSASTVDYHLRKVFRKLDISSRQQLSRTLPVSP